MPPTTDFYDDDLAKHRSASRKTRGESDANESAATKSAVDPQQPRLSRQKEQVEDHMAHAAQELERLRQRQENLEKERSQLEELRRRQAEYERGKRELLEHLNQSIIRLEKEELNAEKVLELVTETRQRCRGWLSDITGINEEDWAEEAFREELSKGLARIDDVRLEFNKALGKIDALHSSEKKAATITPVASPDAGSALDVKGFSHWLKVGFAFSLPIIITLVILWLLYYMQVIGLLL